MSLFHDEEDETGGEPVNGLPAALPQGEEILWQGKPNPRAFAIDAMRLRWVGLWFGGFAAWRVAHHLATGGESAAVVGIITNVAVMGVLGMALLGLIGWLMARSTVYTFTNKRVVLRFGVAIRKYINVPFSRITSAGLKDHGQSVGSIALQMQVDRSVPFLHLWPHARPFRFIRPQPLLRAVPGAKGVAETLCAAIADNAGDDMQVRTVTNADRPRPATDVGIASATA